jgi:hypothetical protein
VNIFVCLVSFLVWTASSQTITWLSATDGDWDTASNWSPATVPSGATVDVVFTQSAAGITLKTSKVVRSITATGSGSSSTSSLTISGNLTVASFQNTDFAVNVTNGSYILPGNSTAEWNIASTSIASNIYGNVAIPIIIDYAPLNIYSTAIVKSLSASNVDPTNYPLGIYSGAHITTLDIVSGQFNTWGTVYIGTLDLSGTLILGNSSVAEITNLYFDGGVIQGTGLPAYANIRGNTTSSTSDNHVFGPAIAVNYGTFSLNPSATLYIELLGIFNNVGTFMASAEVYFNDQTAVFNNNGTITGTNDSYGGYFYGYGSSGTSNPRIYNYGTIDCSASTSGFHLESVDVWNWGTVKPVIYIESGTFYYNSGANTNSSITFTGSSYSGNVQFNAPLTFPIVYAYSYLTFITKANVEFGNLTIDQGGELELNTEQSSTVMISKFFNGIYGYLYVLNNSTLSLLNTAVAISQSNFELYIENSTVISYAQWTHYDGTWYFGINGQFINAAEFYVGDVTEAGSGYSLSIEKYNSNSGSFINVGLFYLYDYVNLDVFLTCSTGEVYFYFPTDFYLIFTANQITWDGDVTIDYSSTFSDNADNGQEIVQWSVTAYANAKVPGYPPGLPKSNPNLPILDTICFSTDTYYGWISVYAIANIPSGCIPAGLIIGSGDYSACPTSLPTANFTVPGNPSTPTTPIAPTPIAPIAPIAPTAPTAPTHIAPTAPGKIPSTPTAPTAPVTPTTSSNSSTTPPAAPSSASSNLLSIVMLVFCIVLGMQ